MTILSFIFSRQSHKNSRGYYINHDNLMTLPTDYRRRLIFYFIAEQTCEKLTNEDRKAYFIERHKMDSHIEGISVGVGLLAMTIKPLKTSMRSYYLYNFFAYAFRFIVASGITYNLVNSVAEGRFVARNQVVKDLAAKYNFSIYDFALAKKQSRLKMLRTHLSEGYFLI